MKLIIQIPCYNEEKTLPFTIRDLPKKIEGIDTIEILVINDGSTDDTLSVAKETGVHHLVDLGAHRGLACAFRQGLEKSLELGADIIVNTDGDNQYQGQDIPKLIKPILEKKAEMIIGCRDILQIKHFSLTKKILQKIGSFVVRRFSGTDIPDATSGFRAYSREAALRLNIFSTYTYTLEAIIQAGRKGIAMAYITIETNEKLRESRLISSMPAYLFKSAATILRIYLMYEPLKTFSLIGGFVVLPGLFLILRFLYLYFAESRSGHIQSLVIAAIMIVMGFGIVLLGLLGDVISANRKLNEEILYRLRSRT